MASQTIDILCSQCGGFILRYQKKGSGQLIRLYLNRVVKPSSLTELRSISNKSDLPTLKCEDCGNRIGLPQEGGTFRMLKGKFRRKAAK